MPGPVNTRRTPCEGDRGLTLLELVVAVFVLSVGTLTVLAAVDQSRIGIGQARARLLAGVVADNRAEELRLRGVALPGTVEMGGLTFTVTQDLRSTAGGLTEVTITATSTGGPGALRVTWLPAGTGP